MAPPKHRELQPTGIGSWEGFANEDLKREVKKFADGIYGGDREVYKAFANSIFSKNILDNIPIVGQISRLFALGDAYANPQATLPIVMEFDSSLSAEERFRAYQGSYNAKGQLTGYLAQLSEQAYIELGWTRRSLADVTGAFSWQPPNNWNGQVPVITINKEIDSNGREIYVPTLLRNNNNELMLAGSDDTLYGNSLSDWSVDKFLGGKGQSNYIKKTGAELANIANKYFPGMKELGVEGLPPSYFTKGVPTPELPFTVAEPAGMEQIQESPLLEGGTSIDPDTGELIPGIVGKDAQEQFQRKFGFTEQNRDLVKQFLISSQGYNIKGIDEGLIEFDFEMDQNGNLSQLDVYRVKDGVRNTYPMTRIDKDTNEKFNTFKRSILTQDPTKPADGLPSGTFSATGAWAVPGFPQTKVPTTFGATGAAGMPTPGIITGSEQQQLLARMYPSEYAAALPASLQGGASSAIRDLYSTPISMAQRGYDLATITGAFQPQQIAGGLGGFGFQQYLGSQPNYIQDLQRGIQAIDQVRQKYLAQGQSTQGFSLPELSIFENYINKPEQELKLRQSLNVLLPYQMRTAYSNNLQNMYDRARLQNPSSIARRQFGFNTGFSPFGNINPMQMQAPTSQAPTAQIPIGQSINMDTSTDNTAVTGTGLTKTTASDGSTITFTPSGDGVTSTATVSQTEPKSSGGTRREAYGDGYAMVQRDSNGLITQVYQIEADGSKRIIRDAKTDVEGADNIYTGKTVKDEDIKAPPITVPPISGAKPTPAPTPKPTATPTPPPTWKAGQPLSEQYLAFLRQGGVSPTQVKELKGTDMQTDDKSVPLVAPSNPLTPPKNITDKLKEIYDRDKMLQRFENYDYQVGKDLTWDPSNQDQFNLYMNQRVRQELGKAEQAKALANAQYMGAGGANVPPLTAPLPMPNTNLPYGYTNYIGFGGAKPPIIAGNSAAVANNYNINKPTVLDLANAFNYTMLPR